MPTGWPSRRAKPTISSGANSGLTSKNDSASTRPSIDAVHVVARRLLVGQHGSRCSGAPAARRCVGRAALPPVAGQVGEPVLGLLDGVGVVDGQVVAAARHGGVHAGAAHLLERDPLADDHLGHAGRAEVHRRVALDHDHDVAEARDVGAAGRRRPEQAADLRHLARQPHLVVEDPPGAAAAGEQLDLVGDAGARPSRPARRPAARGAARTR